MELPTVSASPPTYTVDGRQNHLRDVAGGSVFLGTATLTGSSSLFGWTHGIMRTIELLDRNANPRLASEAMMLKAPKLAPTP